MRSTAQRIFHRFDDWCQLDRQFVITGQQLCRRHWGHGCGPLDSAAEGGGVRDSDRACQAVVPITHHPAAGAGITLILSMGLGWITRSQGVLVVEALPEQIAARLEPNKFDLAIALAAGAIAIYAKVNSGAVSSMAGTAIAMALVPPVCVMG